MKEVKIPQVLRFDLYEMLIIFQSVKVEYILEFA